MYIRSSPRRPNRDPNQTLSNKLLLFNLNKVIYINITSYFKGYLINI